jgi:hypothetical protein
MKIFNAALLGCALTLAMSANAGASQFLSREPADGEVRLGQRVYVDDGSCPGGQVKEIIGSRLGPSGVIRTSQCIPRKNVRN